MTFEQENEAILQDILEDSFYAGFKDPLKMRYESVSLEMNITATCNQKCEYCYLTKFGKDIYPVEIRKEEDILKNMDLLIGYFISNKMNPHTLDIFSGEIWGTPFGDKVLQKLYDAIVYKGWGIDYIMIPSNMSFIMDEKKLDAVTAFIDKFSKIGVQIAFSASVDGPYLDASQRSFVNEDKNNLRDSDFYEKLFEYCKKYRFAFHPMVAAHGIEQWVDNYRWWQYMFSKYRLDPFEYGMYLEVRNDEWTLEKIDKYLDFVNYMIDWDIEHLLGGEVFTFIKDNVFGEKNKGYFPYTLLAPSDTFNCTINTSLIVRMGDLGIGPCHRTHYEQFLYGRYRVENDKIVGVDANNIQLAQNILNGANSKIVMQCEKCAIHGNCMRGCLGAQYEATGEILQPCSSVCHLQKARLIFLYLKYKKLGAWELIKKEGNLSRQSYAENFEEMMNILKEGEPQLWNHWERKTLEKIS